MTGLTPGAQHAKWDAFAGTDTRASALSAADPNDGNPLSARTGVSKFDTVTPTSLIPFSGGKTRRMRSRFTW